MNSKLFRNFLKAPYLTYLFLGIQTVLFLLMEIVGFSQGGSESITTLIQFGALDKGAVLMNHEYWRLITPIFLHIGWTHFIINSVTLYFIGQQVEKIFGPLAFFLMYLGSGILGNVTSFAFGSPNAISAGASTSLFGLFGAFILLGYWFKNSPGIAAIARNYFVFVVMNLVFNLFSSSVDMAGHIGGFIGGLLLAIATSGPKEESFLKSKERQLAFIVWLILLFGFLFYGFKKYGFTL